MAREIKNFGRNLKFHPDQIYYPGSADEVLDILTQHQGSEIRAVGSLHSWSQAPATTGIMMVLQNLNSVDIVHDNEGSIVKVGAGCQLKRLVRILGLQGLTLPSLGLIDEQTVAGATATGTHGSGKNSLSHYIESASIAHYDSSTGKPTVTVVDSGQALQAARCSLGLMGVVVSLTFRCRTKYNIEEHASRHTSLESVIEQESLYPQQQFYLMPWSWHFFAHRRVETDARRSATASLYHAYSYFVVDIGLHIAIFAMSKLIRLKGPVQFFYKRILPLTIVPNWKVVDDSSSMLTMEHEMFRHIEIEVFVQQSKLDPATRFLTDVISVFGGEAPLHRETTESLLQDIDQSKELERLRGSYVHHYPICFRKILPDNTLISMASPGTKVDEPWYSISLISFQWPNDRRGFIEFAEFIGPAFARLFGGRCHWGKFNPLDRSLNDTVYPKIEEFRETIRQFDSEGKFKNTWFQKLF